MAQAARRNANPHKGEVLWQGLKLCLTMNALVEIEVGLDVSLSTMGKALANPKVSDIRLILGALARGGGETVTEEIDGVAATRPISDEEVGARIADIPAASKAIEAAFQAAGIYQPGKGEPAPGK